MEKLPFVIWMCCYPVACAIVDFLGAKRRQGYGRGEYSDGVVLFGVLVDIAVYSLIGIGLWKGRMP